MGGDGSGDGPEGDGEATAAAMWGRGRLALDARTLTEEQWAPLDGVQPVVLTHALETATDTLAWDPTAWFRRVLDRHSETPVKFGQRHPGLAPGRLQYVQSPLRSALAEMAANSHETHSTYMDENLLEEDLRQEVLQRLPGPMRENYFEKYFPPDLAVAPLCFIAGGPGSRSTLHCDHLSWTGWNYLLTGVKLWRFYRRSAEHDAIFGARRKPLWGTEVHPEGLAGNWYSSCDLFHGIEGEPGQFASSATSEKAGGGSLHPVLGRPHRFLPRPSSEGCGRIPEPTCELLQRSGEMIVFPGDWWHQTYHYTCTVAVSAQYCNHRNISHVLRHILHWCGVPAENAARLLAGTAKSPPAAHIEEVLKAAARHRCHIGFGDSRGGGAAVRGGPTPPRQVHVATQARSPAALRRPYGCTAHCSRKPRWAAGAAGAGRVGNSIQRGRRV